MGEKSRIIYKLSLNDPEEILMKDLKIGDRIKIKDDGEILIYKKRKDFLVSSKPIKNSDGVFQVDLIAEHYCSDCGDDVCVCYIDVCESCGKVFCDCLGEPSYKNIWDAHCMSCDKSINEGKNSELEATKEWNRIN